MENEENETMIDERNQDAARVAVKTPFGPIEVNMIEWAKAKDEASRYMEKMRPIKRPFSELMIEEFLGGKMESNSMYWKGNFGKLMKYHLDTFAETWKLVKELLVIGVKSVVDPIYGNVEVADIGYCSYLSIGQRFYERENGDRISIQCSIDHDGDDRIKIDVLKESELDPLAILKELEQDFYLRGPLKGSFFDLRYNFISRRGEVSELLAWDDDIRATLTREVIDFHRIMPLLAERGLPNSRGIILSGPPGTGKTMYAKAIAAETSLTTILISSEMINNRYDVKGAFTLARKLSPSLIIVEDIDTTGVRSRTDYGDHPVLGEFLQSLDGLESNDGVIILATTNHTEHLDPAISDRPGRFDRIIPVGLPKMMQRREIIANLLSKMPTKVGSNRALISRLAERTDELSGAWIAEIVNSALIQALGEGREEIVERDLTLSLKDVRTRRGLAQTPTPSLTNGKLISSQCEVA